MGYGDDMEKMVGEAIQRVWVSGNREYLKIETDQATRVWYADGDCCSRTWIDDISGVDVVRGRRIVKVDEPHVQGEPPAKHPREYQDCVKYYRTELATEGGTLVVDYRNDSNGYYGGSLLRMETWPESINFREITTNG